MDTASSAALPARALAAPAGLPVMARLATLPTGRKVGLGLALLVLAAIVFGLATWARQPTWRVLFTNLTDKDAGAIVTQLAQMNVPYRYADAGGALLVPAEQVHDARIKLAQAGLPKGSIVGFELMDNAKFGQTQFQERLSFQRGLEGELARSIVSLSTVQSARVHLALPQQNGFFREQEQPRASVLVSLYPGHTLDRAQIAGIVHLVSSAVAELNPKAVSIVDQTGTLLSGNDENGTQGLSDTQLHYQQQIEAGLQRRLIDLLEPVVGAGNLRATVSAELDFAQTEATSEAWKPNQGDQPAAVRSAHVLQTGGPGNTAAQAGGVPGAASNQPGGAPAAASAPATATAANEHVERTTNYELDKTVKVTRNAVGSVKRVLAAVVINQRSVTGAGGKSESRPMSAAELDKLVQLAQQAVGFDATRGDSVKVVEAPFQVETEPALTPVPAWRQPWLLDLLRSLGAPLALGLVGLGLVFGVIRPALRSTPATRGAGAASGTNVDALVADELALPGAAPQAAVPGPATELQLAGARDFARRHPQAVAGVVRDWSNKQPA